MTTVLIADPQPLFRQGLVRAIVRRPTIRVVAQVGNGYSAIEQMRQMRPDVAVVADDLPTLGALRLLEIQRRDGLTTRTVVLFLALSAQLLYDAVASGAAGAVARVEDEDTICDAIEGVVHADWLQAQAITALAQETARRAALGTPIISAEDHKMLMMLADGKTSRETANSLGITPTNASARANDLFGRLGAATPFAAGVQAVRRGLLPVDDAPRARNPGDS